MGETLKGDACMIDTVERDLSERITQETAFIPPFSCSIYKAPATLGLNSGWMFEPDLISIGPYHRGKETLATDNYKAPHLQSFIRRNPNVSLKDYIKAIRGIEAEARECYAEQINLRSDDFVGMMVLDGCFILELLLKYQVEESNMESKGCLNSLLRRDIVLLENQIPFLVLDCLYNLSQSPTKATPLAKLALDFFDPILPSIKEVNHCRDIGAKHLLDLLRGYLVAQFKPMDFGDNRLGEYTTCATALQEAGVRFRRKDTAECLLDVTFTDDGKFKMPPFSFGESWSILFSNLIALEQCRRDYPDMITSYVLLVNRLINSQKDVKLLSGQRIMEGCLFIKAEKLAQVVDELCQEVVVDKFYYKGLCDRVNAYQRNPWNKWRATLTDNHFSTNWADISYGAAVMFLVLVLAQTFRLVLTSS